MQFYAQPYDVSATGFYFDDADDFDEKAEAHRCEEFEIQFIEGDAEECELAQAWGLTQGSLREFCDFCDDASDFDKVQVMILLDRGYSLHLIDLQRPDLTDDVYICHTGSPFEFECWKEYAEECLENGHFGEIPEAISWHIDMESVARELKGSHTFINFAGTGYIYAD